MKQKKNQRRPRTIQEILEEDLKKTLNNPICSAQCLDVAADRRRVLKELMNTLQKYEIWQRT